MKILSWNVLASEWIKKSYYPTVKENILFDRRSRLKRIMERIIYENPDIILLQEVMSLEYKTFMKYLNNKYHLSFLNTIDWSDKDNKKEEKPSESGNVTLLKKTIFKRIIQHKKLDLNTGLYTSTLYKNKQIHIYNIHLNDLHGQTRNKQINSIRPLIAEQKYCIIAGDFNQEYKRNSKLYTIDDMTVHNMCPTYYIEKNMNIDNILTKGLKKQEDPMCNHVPIKVENGFKMYGSDHIPVTVVVDI
jgi:endonuclease/exonuclease/phosphatase family metal-dependent hydrolase